MRVWWGVLAFAMFFLGDWNDWKWGRPALRLLFPLGLAVLAGVTAGLIGAAAPCSALWGRIACFAGAAASLALLVYTLFFALPAGDAYMRQEGLRPVCTTGVYALCRHPGFWWLLILYLCLRGSLGVPLSAAALYTALNFLLVLFEDVCVFPARLSGYREYRRNTPFLLPRFGPRNIKRSV